MPSASELERVEQENRDELRRVSGTLNRDAFAYTVLEEQVRDQQTVVKVADRRISLLRAQLEHAEADAATARDRIASLQDTLSRMEGPRG